MMKREFLEAMGVEVYQLRSRGSDEMEFEQVNASVEDSPQEAVLEAHIEIDEQKNQLPVADDAKNSFEVDFASLAELANGCTRCQLSRSRTQVVFGSGCETAELMFIGEGPGAQEDQEGLPFVGKAGRLLTSMIAALGFQRDDVYICNVVKCRPPNNRDPHSSEAVSCAPFLRRQIALVQPKVLVALGRVSAQLLLDTEVSLSSLRKQKHKYEDTGIDLVVTYHPAYLLRKPSEKAKSWEDLWYVRQLLEGTSAS